MGWFRPLAVVVAAFSGGALVRFCGAEITGEGARATAGTLVGANATLLGFLVSAGALLYAVSATTLAQNLMRTGHFQNLLKDLFLDSAAFLAAFVASLVCMFLPAVAPPHGALSPLAQGLAVTGALTVLAVLLLLPVGRKLWLLLSNLSPGGPLQ